MKVKKETRQKLRDAGVGGLYVIDEEIAQEYLRLLQHWPEEMREGAEGTVVLSGVKFTIRKMCDMTVVYRVEKGYWVRDIDMMAWSFLRRVRSGEIIIKGYTPDELKDGKCKPEMSEHWDAKIAKMMQPLYEVAKRRLEAGEELSDEEQTIRSKVRKEILYLIEPRLNIRPDMVG